ncbi:MAG: 1,2-phenylacetyl-CoA epoxidase subunit PaaB [Actinomycetota bacterium]
MSAPAPLWEVFVRARRGLAHGHVGSVHAPDPELALQAARDLFTRRAEGVSIWVVPSSAIVSSTSDDAEALFEPTADKPYRHASYYQLPPEVAHM